MKYRIFYITSLFVFSLGCRQKLASRTTLNQERKTSSGTPMLIGQCTEDRLRHEPFDAWYINNFNSYSMDTVTLAAIKSKLHRMRFEIFMGTWCGDSRREVPRMFRILQYCGVRPSHIKLIMLDNHDSTYKQSPGGEQRGMNIHRVPDLLVFDAKREIGRIVESPVNSLEKDLMEIVERRDYVPNYHAVNFLIKFFATQGFPAFEPRAQELAIRLKPLCNGPSELNTYGYVLMAAGNREKAQLVFTINTLIYPSNPDVFDSLGEFFYKTGRSSLAKANYSRVLQLDPANENARKMMAVLQ